MSSEPLFRFAVIGEVRKRVELELCRGRGLQVEVGEVAYGEVAQQFAA